MTRNEGGDHSRAATVSASAGWVVATVITVEPNGIEPFAAERRVSGVQLHSESMGSLAVRPRRLRPPVGHVRNGRQVSKLRRAVSVDCLSRMHESVSAQGVVSIAA